MDDAELVDRLNSFAEHLPVPLVTFAECLARLREEAEAGGAALHLTESQRDEAQGILTALALGHTGKKIPAEVPAGPELGALAERVRDLRARKKTLEAELSAATEELVAAIGIGATIKSTELRVRVGEPRLSVKVPDATALAPQFLSLQPDRKAILAHVREAAQVPAGAEISETKATVYFSAP